jgi:hypothetical protein
VRITDNGSGIPVQMLESLVSPNTEGVAAYPLSLLLLYGLALLLLAGFYWVVLPHQRVRRRVFIGAALGIVLFVLVSSVFALYVARAFIVQAPVDPAYTVSALHHPVTNFMQDHLRQTVVWVHV